MKTNHFLFAAAVAVLTTHSFANAELPSYCQPSQRSQGTQISAAKADSAQVKQQALHIKKQLDSWMPRITEFYGQAGFPESSISATYLRTSNKGTLEEIYADLFGINIKKCSKEMEKKISRASATEKSELLMSWTRTFFMESKNNPTLVGIFEDPPVDETARTFDSIFAYLSKRIKGQGMYTSELTMDGWL